MCINVPKRYQNCPLLALLAVNYLFEVLHKVLDIAYLGV